MEQETTIIVRDRRAQEQFSIHNRIIDEWYPIIGRSGFTLYALYVRMANKADERSYPSIRMIRQHTGMGNATITDHNKLLALCGLIHIEEGDRARPNEYYILEIPHVTPDVIERIRREATATLPATSKFLRTLLKRLDGWQPITAFWKGARPRPQVVVTGQLTLFNDDGVSDAEHPSPAIAPSTAGVSPAEHRGQNGAASSLVDGGAQEEGVSPAEHPTQNGRKNGLQPVPPAVQGVPPAVPPVSPADHPVPPAVLGVSPAEASVRPEKRNNPKEQSETTIQRNNPKGTVEAAHSGPHANGHAPPAADSTARILTHAGIIGDPHHELSSADPAVALAWLWATAAEGMPGRFVPGYLVKRLRAATPPPPAALDIAHAWLGMDPTDRETLRAFADSYRPDPQFEFADHIADGHFTHLYTDSLNLFYQLYRQRAPLTDW